MKKEKTNTEILCENLLNRINREAKICEIVDEKVDDEFIDKLTDEWIELMKKSLEKYQ